MRMDAPREPGATGDPFFLRADHFIGDYGSTADPFSGARWVGGREGVTELTRWVLRSIC